MFRQSKSPLSYQGYETIKQLEPIIEKSESPKKKKKIHQKENKQLLETKNQIMEKWHQNVSKMINESESFDNLKDTISSDRFSQKVRNETQEFSKSFQDESDILQGLDVNAISVLRQTSQTTFVNKCIVNEMAKPDRVNRLMQKMYGQKDLDNQKIQIKKPNEKSKTPKKQVTVKQSELSKSPIIQKEPKKSQDTKKFQESKKHPNKLQQDLKQQETKISHNTIKSQNNQKKKDQTPKKQPLPSFNKEVSQKKSQFQVNNLRYLVKQVQQNLLTKEEALEQITKINQFCIEQMEINKRIYDLIIQSQYTQDLSKLSLSEKNILENEQKQLFLKQLVEGVTQFDNREILSQSDQNVTTDQNNFNGHNSMREQQKIIQESFGNNSNIESALNDSFDKIKSNNYTQESFNFNSKIDCFNHQNPKNYDLREEPFDNKSKNNQQNILYSFQQDHCQSEMENSTPQEVQPNLNVNQETYFRIEQNNMPLTFQQQLNLLAFQSQELLNESQQEQNFIELQQNNSLHESNPNDMSSILLSSNDDLDHLVNTLQNLKQK